MNVTKINTVPTFRLACNITIMTIIIPLTTKASNKPKSFIQFYPCHTMAEIKYLVYLRELVVVITGILILTQTLVAAEICLLQNLTSTKSSQSETLRFCKTNFTQ